MKNAEKIIAYIAYPVAIGLFALGSYAAFKGEGGWGIILIGGSVFAGLLGLSATHPANRNDK